MNEQAPGITWTVQTHEHQERSTDWYWTLGLLAIIGAALAAFFSDVLLALIILVGAGSLGFLTARGPREHSVRIDQKGITIDGTFYPHTAVESFGVGFHAGKTQLALSMSNFLSPHVLLPLDGISPEVVRMTMQRYAKEKEYQPRLVDTLAEIVGL